MRKNHLPFYLLTLVLVIVLKLFFAQATNAQLQIIVAPTSYLVTFFSGLHFDFQVDQGFYNEQYQVLIDKSCAGTNFFVISFSLAVLVSIRYYQKISHQLILFITLLLTSFILTLLANTFRINTAIFLLKLKVALPFLAETTWHTIQGAFIYLSMLIGFHFLLHYIHSKIIHRYA